MAAIFPVSSQEKHEKTKPSTKSITLRISKFNPGKDHAPTFLEFPVSYEKWTTVLDAILEVKNYHDHSIGVRYSCRQAMCGSCGMIINGKPKLACFTKISELNSNVVTVEPMNNFPLIRDLVVGFEKMFSTHKRIKPYIIREDSEISSGAKEFLQTPEDVEKYIQFSVIFHNLNDFCIFRFFYYFSICPFLLWATHFNLVFIFYLHPDCLLWREQPECLLWREHPDCLLWRNATIRAQLLERTTP